MVFQNCIDLVNKGFTQDQQSIDNLHANEPQDIALRLQTLEKQAVTPTPPSH